MTRYGRSGYDRAMNLPTWERRQYLKALAKLLEEEKKASGLPIETFED